jgi:hypothetical protein
MFAAHPTDPPARGKMADNQTSPRTAAAAPHAPPHMHERGARAVIVTVLAYYGLVATLMGYQRITAAQAAALACRRSAADAAMLVLMTYEMRANHMASLEPAAGRAGNMEVRFFETPGAEFRTSDSFSAQVESDGVMTGELFWISYRVRFLDKAQLDVACFTSVFERVAARNL